MTAFSSTIFAYIVIGALLWGYATHLLIALVKQNGRTGKNAPP